MFSDTLFPQPPLQTVGADPHHVRLFGINSATVIACIWGIAFTASAEEEMDENLFFDVSKNLVSSLTGLGITEQVGAITTLANLKIVDVQEDFGDIIRMRLNLDTLDNIVFGYRFGE